MTTLITEPELVETAAKSVTAIRSVISEAKVGCRGPDYRCGGGGRR